MRSAALKRHAEGSRHLEKAARSRKAHDEELEFPLRDEATNEGPITDRNLLSGSIGHNIYGPGILTSRPVPFCLITQPFYGLRRHARTGMEEDTAGLPGLLAQAVPMILPLELPQAA